MHGSKKFVVVGCFLAFVVFGVFTLSANSRQAVTTKSGDWGIVIAKKDITSTAKYYPYTVNGKPMEVFAVKARDGTIRTALNTCQMLPPTSNAGRNNTRKLRQQTREASR